MAILPKVSAEVSGSGINLKDALADKLKAKRMTELDDATVESTVQKERTKIAEMEAKEVEAQSRKLNAEMSMVDKVMPQGMWGLMGKILEDRNPQAPMTVQDMLSILEYARMQGGDVQEQPADGMWGFLTAMITSMMSSNKQITPIELVETIQKLTPQQSSSQAQTNPISQMGEMIQIFQLMKGIFAPPPQPSNVSVPIDIGNGAAIPLNQLMEYQNHNFNLDLRREEHIEKMNNFKSVRENAPAAISAIGEIAAALRGSGNSNNGNINDSGNNGSNRKIMNSGVERMECPDCGLIFTIPAGVEGTVGCPKCTMDVLQRMEARNNAEANNQEPGQDEDISK